MDPNKIYKLWRRTEEEKNHTRTMISNETILINFNNKNSLVR